MIVKGGRMVTIVTDFNVRGVSWKAKNRFGELSEYFSSFADVCVVK